MNFKICSWKWRILCGRLKFKKCHDLNETPFEARIFLEFNGLKIWYSGVFGVADYKSQLITYKYEMADKNGKSYLSVMTFCTQGCLGSLITNPSSKLRNSKSRIECGRRKCKIYLIGMIFCTRGFWGRWSMLKIRKFITADLIWQTKKLIN